MPDNTPLRPEDLMKNIPLVEKVAPTTPSETLMAKQAEAQAGTNFQGEIKGGDGRTLYKYHVNGQQVILPKRVEEMTEQDFYNLPITHYDAQAGRLPQQLTVKFKDPQWCGYWFNRSAKDGMRVASALALGFTPAKREDLEWYFKGLNDADGSIVQGDLVLMKIHKAVLIGQFYKQWLDVAKVRGGIDGYKNNALSELSGQNRDKVEYYHTPQALKEYQGLGPVTNLPVINS